MLDQLNIPPITRPLVSRPSSIKSDDRAEFCAKLTIGEEVYLVAEYDPASGVFLGSKADGKTEEMSYQHLASLEKLGTVSRDDNFRRIKVAEGR